VNQSVSNMITQSVSDARCVARQSSAAAVKGGATVLKVEVPERKKIFDPHLLLTWGDIKQNIAHVSLL